MAGRPPGEKSFTAMLRIAINEASAQGGTKLRDVADALVTKAISGDVPAIKEIADRIDGKVTDKLDMNLGASDPLAALLESIAARGRRIHDPGP